MRCSVLGPLEIRRDDGSLLNVPGAKERLLLALLATASPAAVDVDHLADQLWDGQPPPTARKSLQVHVVRLRSALEPDRATGSPGRFVVRRPHGYALVLDHDQLDAAGFVGRVARGRAMLTAGDAAGADTLLREALGLWRGTPYGDWPDVPDLQRERARLEGIRVHATEAFWDAELTLGRHAEAVPELERLSRDDPLHEGWWARLALALYRCDRQAAALEALRRARAILGEELGVDPGPALRDLEQAVLRQDPTLELPPSPTVGAVAAPEARFEFEAGCPYKGLARYEADDAPLFHGRERVLRTLLGVLVDHRVLVVSGSSGAGKSSLVRAALLPALTSGALPGSAAWRPRVVVPGPRPVDALAPVTAMDAPADPAVLVCDQLEQLWLPDVQAGERAAFLDTVLGLAADELVCRCVLVVRADHLGRLAEHGDLAHRMLGGMVMVPPMTEGEIRQVVEGPAADAGLSVEPDLTDVVVADVLGRSGALPLLSTALARTWERRRNHTLTLAGYLATGGVAGAVSRSAEQLYASWSEQERERARQILVRLAEQDRDGTVRARPLPVVELAGSGTDVEVTTTVLESLVAARLVARAEGHLEVAHEALLTAWPRLAAWLDDDAVGRSIRAHLAPAAVEWVSRGRPSDELYRGARLEAAAEWTRTPGAAATAHELEFVGAGLELQHAELTAARERAAAEAAGRRRTRRFASLLAGALVLAVLAAGVAVFFQGRATERAAAARRAGVVADANRLAALSSSARSLDLSLLLAAAAVRTADTPATRDGLLNALLRHDRATGVLQLGREGITETALSANGRTMLATVGGGSPRLLAWQPGSPDPPVTVDEWWPESLAVSPDGETLMAAGTFRPFGVFTYSADGERLLRLGRDDLGGVPRDVAFTGAGRGLVLLGRDRGGQGGVSGVVVRLDQADGSVHPIASVGSTDSDDVHLDAAFSDDASAVVVYRSDHRRAWLLDLRTERTRRLDLPDREASSLEFVAIPRGAAQLWSDGSITRYDASGTAVQELDAHRAAVRDVRLVPGARHAISVGDAGQVEVWDIDPQDGRWSWGESLEGHSAPVLQAEVAARGGAVLTVSSDGQLVTWDLSPGAGLGSPYPGLEQRWVSNRIEVVEPGRLVVAPTRTLSAQPRSYQGAPGPDTLEVAAVFMDPRDGRVVDTVPVGRTLQGTLFGSSVSVSPDATWVAVTTTLRTTVLDADTREVVARIQEPRMAFNDSSWSPDGSRLILAAEEWRGRFGGALVEVDTQSWQVVGQVPLDSGSPQVLQWSPDHVTLVAGVNFTGGLVLYDQSLRQVEAVDLGEGGDAFDVAFSPDGRYLAAARGGGQLTVLDTSTWEPVNDTVRVHPQIAEDVEWLPDNTTVVTAGNDEMVSLYDVRRDLVRGAPLPVSDRPGDGVTFLMPSPGDEVVALNEGGPGRSYPLDPARWLARACTVAGRDLTRAEWARYLPDRDYQPVCDLASD